MTTNSFGRKVSKSTLPIVGGVTLLLVVMWGSTAAAGLISSPSSFNVVIGAALALFLVILALGFGSILWHSISVVWSQPKEEGK